MAGTDRARSFESSCGIGAYLRRRGLEALYTEDRTLT